RRCTGRCVAASAGLRPGQLADLIDRLPPGSLPSPVGADVSREPRLLREEPLLSSCVEGTLRRLAPKADREHPLSAEEVFIDVAKHGTGASVAQLREPGRT